MHDRLTGETTLISVHSDGPLGNGSSQSARISGDGRYVIYRSEADNLVEGDSNNAWDLFLHDRQTGRTVRLSVDAVGNEASGDSLDAAISVDGTTIVFESQAANLVSGDTNARRDIFAVDNPLAFEYSISALAWLVQSQGEARFTLDALDSYLEELYSISGSIGAGMARLEVSQNHLFATVEVFTTADSRIRDVDVAEEAARFVQAQILQQSGSAVLAQANQQASMALVLLNGLGF